MHALLEVEDLDLGNRAVLAGQALQVVPDPLVGTAFFRHDQQHLAIGARQQLTVEQVRTHCIFDGYLGTRHANRLKIATAFSQFSLQFAKHGLGVEKGILVIEQDFAVTHRNHVVMEYALVDDGWILLGEDHSLLAQAMQAGNGLRGFEGLPGGIFLRGRVAAVERATAIHEELHTGLAVLTAKTRVVGRPLITELRHRRQCGVVSKVLLIGKHGAQYTAGGRVLDAAVILAV
ncbi:hypothetical protein D3C80_926220 [compost metagenome]